MSVGAKMADKELSAFLKATTIHGFNHLAANHSKLERFFWLAALAATALALYYNVQDDEPLVTATMDVVPSHRLPYLPAITVDSGPFISHKVTHFLMSHDCTALFVVIYAQIWYQNRLRLSPKWH